MITLTPTLYAALKAGAMPIIWAVYSTGESLRVYGKTPPLLGQSSPTIWDGSWLVGQGTFGGELGLAEAAARVLSFGSLETRLTYSSKDILGSFAQAEIGSVQVVLDNADGHFSRLLGDNAADTFLNGSFELRLGAPGVGEADYVSLYRGTVTEEKLTAKTLKLTAEPVTPSLFEDWTIPTAGRYADPSDSAAALPYVWGDLAENSGVNGAYVCPCINSTSKIYCLAAHALPGTATVTLYDDDGLITTGYSVTYSGNLEGQGTIAYVTMTSHTVTGSLSATVSRGKDSLTNPIDILADILDTAGDLTERDTATWARARAFCASAGYTAAGVIASSNPPAYWLTDVLSSFLGAWYLNGQQAIVINLSTDTSSLLRVVGDAYERESNLITGTRTRTNLCNQIVIDYAVSSSRSDKRYKTGSAGSYLATDLGLTSQDTLSINKYGLRSVRLGLNWTRNLATVNALQAYIIEQFADPTWTIDMTDETFRLAAVDAGDVITYAWEDRIDADGEPITKQLARVMNISKDLDTYTITLNLQDLNTAEIPAPRVWDGTWLIGTGTFGSE